MKFPLLNNKNNLKGNKSRKDLIKSINPVVELKNINYFADNISILKNVNFKLGPSEFLALYGDHGSGKSSIGMIISGIIKPASGSIYINDKKYNSLTLNKTRKLKIEMIYKQIFLLDYFTIAENLFISQNASNSFKFFNKKQAVTRAYKLLEEYGINIDPLSIVKNLQLSEKMVIYILKSILNNPHLLILDEALEKLAPRELNSIIKILNEKKEEGMSILCITNKIDDVYNFADKITILKDGEILLTDSVDNLDRLNLIKMCYTQINKQGNIKDANQEFYRLLTYNEAILQKLPINLVVTDNKNRIKMINNLGQRFFDLDKKSFAGMQFEDLLGEQNKESFKFINSALKKEKEKAFYNVTLNFNKEKFIVNIITFPIFDGKTHIGNMIILEDVSEQENLRQQMILSEQLASVGLLAAGVAHEINNPLEIIYNYLNYLKLKQTDNSLNETLSDLEEEITYIKNIVSNLILFSDSNKRADETFDLNDVIESLIRLIKFNAKNKKIEIKYNKPAKSYYLKAIKNEIKQVILNLLKNSFEAISDGGIISIDIKETELNFKKAINIIIKDTGCGITDEDFNHIFLPFYSTKKKDSSNMGLGLSVSYGIIKKNKGEISVKNIENSGCEFSIILPYKNK